MQKLKFLFLTKLDFSSMIGEHHFILRCVPQVLPEQQVVDLDMKVMPQACTGVFSTDSFGNQLYAGSLLAPHRFFYYRVNGEIVRDDGERRQEAAASCLRYPTKLTSPSEEMRLYADELWQQELSGLSGDGYRIASRLSDIIYKSFTYAPGSTNVHTTAAEAFRQRSGVCQDYVHVFLAIARLYGIPARYVSGLPFGEGATHAWVEVWHEGLWYGLDPTRGCLADEGYIKLNVGRDFNDCPIERGVFRGQADQLQTTYMKVDIL